MKTTDKAAVEAARTLDGALRDGVLITVKETEEKLGISHQAVLKLINRNRLADLRVGHARFTLSSDVSHYKAEKEAKDDE